MSDNQLWSDEQIDQEVLSKIDEFLEVDGDRENDTGLLTASSVDSLMRAMRDDYEQRIAELQPRYPELDASIEAGDEVDAWKEKCHALETENAALQSWCKAVEERLKADIDQQKEDMAENARLRGLLPGPITREAIRRRIVIGRGAWDEGTLVQAWLDKLESENP